MNNKILHVAGYSTFMPPFLNMLHSYFEHDKHTLIVTPSPNKVNLPQVIRIEEYEYSVKGRIKYSLELVIEMHKADKIIIHGLFDLKTLVILFFMPWLLKKSCWVMWGGDLYAYKLGKKNLKWKLVEIIRRPVIKNFAYFTTTVPGDFELAKRWYSSKSKFIQNLMYTSHVARPLSSIDFNSKVDKVLNIQIGNSADPTNHHKEVFEYLSKFPLKDVKVYCPLSYGSPTNKDLVIMQGKELLGSNFVPMTEFMEFSKYNEYMKSVDVAIFNHNRQQAMGNIIGLLSLGKKVVFNPDTTPYAFFKNLGLEVYSLKDVDIFEPFPKDSMNRNIRIMRENFSFEKLKSDWDKVFNAK